MCLWKIDGQPVLKFAAAYGFRNIQVLIDNDTQCFVLCNKITSCVQALLHWLIFSKSHLWIVTFCTFYLLKIFGYTMYSTTVVFSFIDFIFPNFILSNFPVIQPYYHMSTHSKISLQEPTI